MGWGSVSGRASALGVALAAHQAGGREEAAVGELPDSAAIQAMRRDSGGELCGDVEEGAVEFVGVDDAGGGFGD